MNTICPNILTSTLSLLENQNFRLIPSTLILEADLNKNQTWCDFEINQDFILHEIDILHKPKTSNYDKTLTKSISIGPLPIDPPPKEMTNVLINEQILLPKLPYWTGYLYDTKQIYIRTKVEFNILLKHRLTIRGRNEYFYNDIQGIIKIFLIQYL